MQTARRCASSHFGLVPEIGLVLSPPPSPSPSPTGTGVGETSPLLENCPAFRNAQNPRTVAGRGRGDREAARKAQARKRCSPGGGTLGGASSPPRAAPVAIPKLNPLAKACETATRAGAFKDRIRGSPRDCGKERQQAVSWPSSLDPEEAEALKASRGVNENKYTPVHSILNPWVERGGGGGGESEERSSSRTLL